MSSVQTNRIVNSGQASKPRPIPVRRPVLSTFTLNPGTSPLDYHIVSPSNAAKSAPLSSSPWYQRKTVKCAACDQRVNPDAHACEMGTAEILIQMASSPVQASSKSWAELQTFQSVSMGETRKTEDEEKEDDCKSLGSSGGDETDEEPMQSESKPKIVLDEMDIQMDL